MPLPENISKEFVYEFLSQLKKSYFERKAEKEKPEEKEEEEAKEMRFIRPLTKKILRFPQSIKPVIEEKKIKMPEMPEKPEPAINKIKNLMKDPITNTIICYGANERVMIKRGNRTVETSYMFSEEDIKGVIKEAANETSTPLKKVFKAQYGNFKINAIMSDFIGSKFVFIKNK